MFKIPEPKYNETPKGKRAFKINIYGDVVGYVGGKRFWEFGMSGITSEREAKLWVKGYELAEIMNGSAYEKEGLI